MREKTDIGFTVTRLLSDFLGVEPADITPDDSLVEDLHMSASDLTDFVEIMTTAGIDTSKLDMTEVETLADLYDKLV